MRYPLSPTLSQQPLCRHLSSPTNIVDQITSKADQKKPTRCSALPKTTAPTIEPTKEKATIKMDDYIDSEGEVSTTKKRNDLDVGCR